MVGEEQGCVLRGVVDRVQDDLVTQKLNRSQVTSSGIVGRGDSARTRPA